MRILLFTLLSCLSVTAFTQDPFLLKPIVPVAVVKASNDSWLSYEREYMVWSANYQAFDTDFTPIAKKEFLEKLTTGAYIPLRMISKDSALTYQLYLLNNPAGNEISTIIKYKALVELMYFNMEGLPLPGYNFVDLDNNIYNAKTTKGKTVVLKCWFINCIPCIAEIPKLNKLVNDFKQRDDVLFLGLAFDKADKLTKFLQKTVFNYQIIPNKEDYLLQELGISAYPTHIIINRNGLVLKVSENLDEIITVLKYELAKRN